MAANEKPTCGLIFRSATEKRLPPRRRSPRSGPPRGTNFSRRNEAEPSPPLPACSSTVASSMNFIGARSRPAQCRRCGSYDCGRYPCSSDDLSDPCCDVFCRPCNGEETKKPCAAAGRLKRREPALRSRDNIDGSFSCRALDCKLDGAWDQGKQSMVLADADIDTRMHLRAALAHDDAARINQFAAVGFDAEALGVRIAAVA